MADEQKDSMRQDAPAAQKELEYLKTVKVGDVRKGALFPAFDIDVEWTCTEVGEGGDIWSFDGRFLGQMLFRIVIVSTPDTLVLYVRGVA